MALKSRVLIVILVILGILLSIIAGGIIFLYKPDFFLSIIFGTKEKPLIENKKEEQKLSKQEIYHLKEIVDENLSRIREGVTEHPAILYKISENDNSTDAYVLTVSELEWPFAKTYTKGNITLNKAKKVFKCKDLFIIDYDITGMVIPSAKTGLLIDKGVIVPGMERGKPLTLPFYGNCSEISGYVFNNLGDFSGICKNGDFIPASWISNLNLSTCSIIYTKPIETENTATQNQTENTSFTNKTENNNTLIINPKSDSRINDQFQQNQTPKNTNQTNIINFNENLTNQ